MASIPHAHRSDTPLERPDHAATNAGGRTRYGEGSPVVLKIESATSEYKPYHEEPTRIAPLQGPQTQEKTVGPRATEVHQKRAPALVAKPLTHATKVAAIQALGHLPLTHTCAQLVLERYLGHHPALFTLSGAVGTGLHQMLEARCAQANDMLQE